jgi:peptidyl-prolyl cis-trans isomerase SurA
MRSLLAASLLAPLAAAASAEQIADGIAAQVGSDVVLVSEVLQAAGPTAARARAAGASDADLRQLHLEALEQMIERALLRQVAKRAEIGASDAEVDEAIAGIARENGITPEKIHQTVEAQGMPYAVYRERIRGEIEHSKVLNDVVAAHVRVSEEDVRALYDAELAKQPQGGDELDLRLIVVTSKGEEPGARAAACAQVADARARVTAGEPFASVAREVSEANPEAGGAQGWVHESEIARWMRPAVESLQPGGLSALMESDFGCAVVLVEDRRAFVPLPYEQAKPRLEKRLFEERMSQEYTKFVAKLRSQTYVEKKGVFANADAPTAPGGEGF